MSGKQSNHSGAAVAKQEWQSVRIYWGDNSPANFDRAFHYPLIRKSSDGQYLKKELIVNPFQTNQSKKNNPEEQAFFNWMVNTDGKLDLPTLKEQVFYFDNPEFKVKPGVSLPPLQQEKNFILNNLSSEDEGVETIGSICDRVEQFIIIEVVMEGGAPISPTKLPKVDVWSFLQDHSIGNGPDSRASGSELVIDDDSKSGWFHCLISPESTKTSKAIQYLPQVDNDFKDYPKYAPVTIEGRLDHARDQIEQVEKKIPLTIDARNLNKGIIRYKIKLTITNELTPEDNMRRWKRVYDDKFGDEPESRTIETGCWLKAWVRNAEFNWSDKADITDALSNDCRDAMDSEDPPVYKGFPRTAKNHYWIRNRLFDAVENKPMYVGLYPAEVIYALNNLEPSMKKMLEKKKEFLKNQDSMSPQSLDSEVDELNVLLGIVLYAAVLGSAIYFIRSAKGSDENNQSSPEEERRESVNKIFNAFQLDIVFAAYAVNGFKEGADAAKTLAEVSSNPDKKTLFKWVSNLFTFLRKISLGEESGDESVDPPEANENSWRAKLKDGVGHELNNDGNWGATGLFQANADGFRVVRPKGGMGKPLGGYLSWLTASAFFGGGAGLDLGVKGAWSPDNGELAFELASGKGTKANIYAGVDIKAVWTRVIDYLKKSGKENGEDSFVGVLETIAQWTNLEAVLKTDLSISGVADLKLKYIYDSSDKPSIWSLLDKKVKGDYQGTNNMLGVLVNLTAPLHLQLSGFTLKYNLFDLVLADIKTEEYALFPRGKFLGDSLEDFALVTNKFPWVRYSLADWVDLIDSPNSFALGDTLEFGLDYAKLQNIPKGEVYAWRLLKYTPEASFSFFADEDTNFPGGKPAELNPTSKAAFDLACINDENSTGLKTFPHSLISKVRFTSFLPKDISKSDAEYQVDFSQASDTYLHFLKEFREAADSDAEGIKLSPQIRVEGMADRALSAPVTLKYPQLIKVDVFRPSRVSFSDSKITFRCNVKHYNDDYIAFALSDERWGGDENLGYKVAGSYSHWNLIHIKDRQGDAFDIEIDLKQLDLEQLMSQVGTFDDTVEIYIKLSFIGALDQSIQLDGYREEIGLSADVIETVMDKYKQDDFLFLGNLDIKERLILNKGDIEALQV